MRSHSRQVFLLDFSDGKSEPDAGPNDEERVQPSVPVEYPWRAPRHQSAFRSAAFVRMKLSTICYFLLAATFSASGQSAGSNRTLNLRGLQFQTAHASGSSLFLSVTGQPPVSIITP